MDKIGGAFESFTGSGGNTNQAQTQGLSTQGQSQGQQQSSGGGGLLGSLGDKLNSAAGGGKESEKNEDYLDKVCCRLERNMMHTNTNAASSGSRLRPTEVHG